MKRKLTEDSKVREQILADLDNISETAEEFVERVLGKGKKEIRK
jgi:hypothetical protein